MFSRAQKLQYTTEQMCKLFCFVCECLCDKSVRNTFYDQLKELLKVICEHCDTQKVLFFKKKDINFV